ncbi:type III restriction endonuclease subunit R [Cronobacter sakazakii]|uniref:type III restriction endonuclease subunit R n=2 Tax=Enterobacterales TaxID=91347 RepID=UPI0009A6DB9B|nr:MULTISPECIES: type III restriction endonuclease subunit R [Enterobacteriaceae]EKK3985231.1 type III restriction endonuclease subunit R [Cronobacter sakazakii]ELY6404880.1 type III restriction endonuclease subunit R [Cronobacter sakazakii]MBF4814903.1 type III restriction endonuclease subunit R [Cronobacter sakazakii]MDT3569473.1 type III restriction endonuclease subunit R [Cronobacter sakazakii]NCH67885.1 type III restriction endonuclease subunit R [Cronobacter sakazakii]
MTNPEPIYSRLKYVSAPCGSGKTTAICNIINNSTGKHILVQNTQELIKQTASQISDCTYIITESVSKDENVINAVIDFLTTPCKSNLIITDKTFFKIPLELLSNWDIYIDDVTNFHSFQNINESSVDIKSVIRNDLIHKVQSLDDRNMYIAAERNPEVQGDVVKNILNQLSVLNENDLFIMNNEYFTDTEKVQLNITAWKDLNKYKELPITFLGANFENSLIYKGNKELFESTELEGLRTRETELKDRLKVYYFSKKLKLSRTWKTNNPDKVQKIYDFLDARLDGQDFYWTKNKSDSQSLKNGTEISPDARGFNKYQHLMTCVWLACMRPSETEAKQCELFFEIDGEAIHVAREYESLHQFVLRGISRDFDSTETQTVYVFDEWQAKSLTDNIEYIDLGIDDDERGQRGRPQGSMNKEKRFTLDDTKAKRFRRWKGSNPGLELEAFRAFLASTTNAGLSSEEIKAMWDKYENEVQKTSRN